MVEQAWQAGVRYEGYRQAARDVTIEDLGSLGLSQDVGDIRLSGINALELAHWASWKTRHFDWGAITADFYPYLDRFEVAIWQGDRLLALSIGRPSKGSDSVIIHFLERCWEDNPLKGWASLIITDVADNYARVLEKQYVKLKNPIPEAIPKYQSIGFSLANSPNRNTYYSRQVTR